jgi:DNA-binding NarL/FixJ family response regulator
MARGESVAGPVRHPEAGRTERLTERLTEREREVVELLCQGLSNASIAQQLWLTEKTVKNHLNHIFAKLGVRSRTEAIVRWTSSG